VDAPTTLYRFFNEAGELLYVGITGNTKGRLKHHRKHATWWSQATTHRLESFPTREEAAVAEAHAIRQEAPIHNVIRSSGRVAVSRLNNRAPEGSTGRLYGLAEIAEALDMRVGTVRMWFQRGKLPPATVVLTLGHVWQGEEIESWINDRKGETR